MIWNGESFANFLGRLGLSYHNFLVLHCENDTAQHARGDSTGRLLTTHGAGHFVAVTPGPTIYSPPIRVLIVGAVGGTISIVGVDGSTATITVAANQIIDCFTITQITAATATGIVAAY